jgi:CRISPR type III-B/RAMP module-associated protein Cmr5
MTPARIDQDMAVAAAAMLPATVTQELRTRYRQLRAMLHSAGLAATYAFVAARSNTRQADNQADNDDAGGALPEAYRRVADGIKARLGRLELLDADPAEVSHRQVLQSLGEANAMEYARASAEITELAGWLSRLADALYQPDTKQPEPS